MKLRVIIRLLLVLGVAGLFLLLQDPPTEESAGPEAPGPLARVPDSTGLSPVHELPEISPEAEEPEADPDLAGLDPEQAEKLAKLKDALQRLTARAQVEAARREGAAVLAPAGEGVVEAEEPSPPFPVDRDGIKAAIGEAIPRVKECYEAWLEANPELAGKLTVSFRIEADPEEPEGPGRIAEAKVAEGGLGNRFLDGCVVASLGELRFETPPPEGLAVTYPFRFAKAEPPPTEGEAPDPRPTP